MTDLAERVLRQHLSQTISLDESEFQMIVQAFTEQQYTKRSAIFREGERVDQVYFIMRGLLKLIYNDEMGKQHILSFAMEDWWETDFQAFFDQTRTKLSLVCLEPSDVLCLPFDKYHQLCRDIPAFEHFLLQKSISGHLAAQARILSLLTSSAKERYEQLLARYPQLLQRLPKTQLAAYLGVTRETLSRLYM